MVRDSDPFWAFLIWSFLIGLAGTVLIFGIWEAVKAGANILDALDVARRVTLGRIRR